MISIKIAASGLICAIVMHRLSRTRPQTKFDGSWQPIFETRAGPCDLVGGLLFAIGKRINCADRFLVSGGVKTSRLGVLRGVFFCL